MSNYKISTSVLTFLYACLVFSYPASFYNDDSLFLSNGIDNFSVIDFSPHFPGYITLVILGKFINIFLNDSKESLFLLTASCAILLPFIMFLYVKRLSCEKVAFYTFLLTISSTYLLNISLSMLSESVGLFFLFLGIYLFEIGKYKSSGFILAISFFARPSYFIFFLIGLVYIFFYKKESLKNLLLLFVVTSIVFLVFIFITNGILYLYEAERFIIGHFSLWGLGQNSEISWLDNIFIIENISFVFLLLVFFNFRKNFTLLYMMFFSYLFWMLNFQNPDNIRHLVPLILLGNIFLAQILKHYLSLILIVTFFNTLILFSYTKLSPIDQIIFEIKDSDNIIITNRSIEILRSILDNRVFDKNYKNSSKYYKNNRKSYVITTTKPNIKTFKSFTGRFIGENKYYLILNDN